MKKNFYFIPLAALALASCSSDATLNTVADISGNTIQFHPIVPAGTRGTEVDKTNMGEFKVVAAASNGLKETSGFTETVKSSSNGDVWTMETNHYWTQNDNNASTDVSFTAYYPTDLTISGGKTTVDLTATKIVDQKDILVAFAKGNRQSNVDGVALNFKHAMSQIVILAANKNTTMRKVEVIGVKLVNISAKAELTLPSTATDNSFTWSNEWGAKSDATDFITKGSEAIELTSEAQDVMFGSGSFMLIPQQLPTVSEGTTLSDNTTNAYISVLCRITNKTDDNIIFPANSSAKYAFTAVPIGTNWEPGKKYTYTLNFYSGDNGGAGQIDPKQDNPDDDNDSDIDDNPGDGGDPTDPGVEKPISFNVTVEDWTAVNAETVTF